ncbi:omega-amidase [Paenibacillus sp. V4I9]|uniref:carbon-nitrogen hydrolase family protein n=1 Tax=Paenibacillus sp. V4I9 TaxID=3042308 RepID=UPI00277F4F83|nr:carbon-nitrogen hydrolase family protein [Paenibacillus sp. V4I9]MDQ0889805.1 omega-amidase [Paenibacillus sp. V4I9]
MANIKKIGICQLRVSSDKPQNIINAEAYVKKASQAGCHLVILPEMFNCPYQTELFPKYAEYYPDGETIAWLSKIAAQEGIVVVGGSIPEHATDNKIYNTSFIFDEKGTLVGRHRKMHLCDVHVDGSPAVQESSTLEPGADITVVNAGGLNFGVGICYDIRFPELSRSMVLNGATVLIFPAAFGIVTGSAHWELLMRSRAVDNQAFVIGAAPARTSGAEYQTWGHSMIVDPWGNIVATTDEKETLLIAEIDIEMTKDIRSKLPLLKHRRPHFY